MKLGVTVRPPCTALPSVTVNVIASPSGADTSATVTADVSSSLIVRMAGLASVTPSGKFWVPSTIVISTVSFPSATSSWSIHSQSSNSVTCSPATPSKENHTTSST